MFLFKYIVLFIIHRLRGTPKVTQTFDKPFVVSIALDRTSVACCLFNSATRPFPFPGSLCPFSIQGLLHMGVCLHSPANFIQRSCRQCIQLSPTSDHKPQPVGLRFCLILAF